MKKRKDFVFHAFNYILTVCKITVAFLVAAWLVGVALEVICRFVTVATIILLMGAAELWFIRQYRKAAKHE